MAETESLRDKVIVVAGATRGCGRAIAVELGVRGATVFACGRTTRTQASPMGRSETIEDTAEQVSAAGGRGIPVRCDFTSVADVDALRAQIESEVDGRLDVLVNDVWGGDPLHEFGVAYWETKLDDVLRMVRNGLESHLVSLHRLLPLLTAKPGGLVIQVTDGDDETYHGAGLAYYLVKSGMRAIGRALAGELAPYGGVGMTVSPGFIRSESMLDHFGVTEQNWRDGAKKEPHFVMAESPHYLGRGVAALASDPEVVRFAGQTVASWTLMHEYGFADLDGSRPDWGRWMADVFATGTDPTTVDATDYR